MLQLLAAGLLNREIAERLVISENTAANHVRSILAKTGSGTAPRRRCSPPGTSYWIDPLGDERRSEGEVLASGSDCRGHLEDDVGRQAARSAARRSASADGASYRQ